MIDAFETGTQLTACGLETDAAVVIAQMREMSAAFHGIAMEIGPENLAALAAVHEEGAVASPAATPGAVEPDDVRSDIWLLLAALRADARGAGEGSASSAFLPASPDPAPGFAAVPVRADPPLIAGGRALEAAGFGHGLIISPAAAREGSQRQSETARADRGSNGWLGEILPSEAPHVALKNGAFASDAPVPSPWLYQLVSSAGGRGIAPQDGPVPDPLTILFGGDRHHGAGAPDGIWFATSTAGPVLASVPMEVLASRDAASNLIAAAPVGHFAARPDGISGWGMPPFVVTPPDFAPRRSMVPPDAGGEASPQGRSSGLSLAGQNEMAPGSVMRLPIQVHTTLHLDGSLIAHAVSEHIVGSMNGPLCGTGGFDPRRSYTPVEG